MADSRRRMHAVAVAGTCRRMIEQLDCSSARDLLGLIQDNVGDAFRVTGDPRLIEAEEDDLSGGRKDDARRAADFTNALADDRVAIILSLRGGAWLTRILPRIDFDVLKSRTTRVALHGFSELTTAVNLASLYPKAVAWYDMGPAFIPAGFRHRQHLQESNQPGKRPRCDAPVLRKHLAEFLSDVSAIAQGRRSHRRVEGRRVSGKLPASTTVKLMGGCLSVLISLIGTPYGRRIFRPGRWLVLEDVNEAPHRLDRMLAHLKLAGVLDRCGGLLLGDFHEGSRDRLPQVLTSLKRILPGRSDLPIVASSDFGHVWPMSPLPLNRAVQLRCRRGRVELAVPSEKLAVAPEPRP